jgi:ABC-2 type transport system permease protein
MNTQSNTMPEPFGAQRIAPGSIPRTQVLLWSIRRELWENRAIYVAPLAVAGVFLLAFVVTLVHLPAKMRALSGLDPMHFRHAVAVHYDVGAGLMMATSILVSVFYCLDALHSERRDRSILFWKSMPVSDLTTVLAKATIPLVILPAIAFVVVCATQLVMLLLNSIALASHQSELTQLWSTVPLFRLWGIVLYALVTLTLWHAPLYGYLLALSAWAKKGPFLWAVLPPIALSVFEKLAFDTSYVSGLIHDRLVGSFGAAFSGGSFHHKGDFHLPQADPAKFLASPGLWVGLVIAVALFALAVWMRRRREPV